MPDRPEAYDELFDCTRSGKNTTFRCLGCKRAFTGSLQKARHHILGIKCVASAVTACTRHYTAAQKQPLQELEDAATARAAKRQRTLGDEQQDPLEREVEQEEEPPRARAAVAVSGGKLSRCATAQPLCLVRLHACTCKRTGASARTHACRGAHHSPLRTVAPICQLLLPCACACRFIRQAVQRPPPCSRRHATADAPRCCCRAAHQEGHQVDGHVVLRQRHPLQHGPQPVLQAHGGRCGCRGRGLQAPWLPCSAHHFAG